MPILEELAAYLATQGIGTVGTNIFYSMMPPEPAACVALFEYTGRPGDYGPGGRAYAEYPRVQVVTRDTSYTTARAKLQTIVGLLDSIQNQTLSGALIWWVRALGTIGQHPSGPDENSRPRCVCNFEVMRKTDPV